MNLPRILIPFICLALLGIIIFKQYFSSDSESEIVEGVNSTDVPSSASNSEKVATKAAGEVAIAESEPVEAKTKIEPAETTETTETAAKEKAQSASASDEIEAAEAQARQAAEASAAKAEKEALAEEAAARARMEAAEKAARAEAEAAEEAAVAKAKEQAAETRARAEAEEEAAKVAAKQEAGAKAAASTVAATATATSVVAEPATDASIPQYVVEDGLVDEATFNGYRRFHGTCHACHGQDAAGGSFAPSLVESLKTIDYTLFRETVTNGRQATSASGAVSAMPGFSNDPNVMKHLDDIYRYVSARSDGVIGAGRPKKMPK